MAWGWRQQDRRRAEGGAVALILVAVLAGLLGLIGLVFDFGRSWIFQTDLQAAVDAAALAGATQLDGRSGARVRAAGAAAGAAARNADSFTARTGIGRSGFDTDFACTGDGCAMSNGSFRFLADLVPRAEALNDADARFVEVSAARGLRFVFAGVLSGIGMVTPRAAAVASWDRYACGRAALLMCNPDEPPGNTVLRARFDPNPHLGKGIVLQTGVAPGAGAMAWLANVTCDPADDTCATEGEPEAVAGRLGRVLAAPSCVAEASVSPATTGDLAAAINTRLDIYAGPDLALDPNFQPSPNSLSGLVPQGGAISACDFPGALGPAAQPFLGPGRHAPLGTVPLDHLGYPRDNCAYPRADGSASADNCMAISPVGAGLPAGRALGTGDWDLPAYMAHHHGGLDLAAWSFNACPAGDCRLGTDDRVDLDGDGRLSRWEVYSWERAGHPPVFGRPQCFGGGTASLPQAPADSPRASDRRLLGALVANCRAIVAAFGSDALRGAGTVPLAGGAPTLSLFLSEAVGELAANAIYVEIVGPQAVGAAPPLVARDRVVLRE